jgi:hypothetical protein
MSPGKLHTRFTKRVWWSTAITVSAFALIATTAALVVSRVRPSDAGASSGSSKAEPLQLQSTFPAPGATGVNPDASLSLHFNEPLSGGGSTPQLNPPVPGTWVQTASDTLSFAASSSLPPGATEQLSVPGGANGIAGVGGVRLEHGVTLSFTVAPMPLLRLQQLLAQLGYLPLSFTPSDPATPSPSEMAMPQAGTFAWRWSSLPANFTSLWSEGQPNVITTGAVMAFESDHNLGSDGIAGPQVWEALLTAAGNGQLDSFGHYDFVEVSTTVPEHVDVWRDGSIVYTSPANTGIEAAPTERGTWPVYARYTSTTMSGTNPDGSHYSDPGVPWVSYFHGGDALHGFIRSSYGTPQSLGCVEMPPANAQVVYPYTPIGTLVTVN